MDCLGIEKEEVDKIILKGMKWKEKDTEKWHANMAEIECVFMRKEEGIFVITVYLNGGEQ